MWVSRRELRRIARELRQAEQRADSAERWGRELVNSVLTARGHAGVPVAPVSEKIYTPTPLLPERVQGWSQEEFIDLLVSEGKTRAEALETWKTSQSTGKLPYQKDEEYVT